MSIFKRLSSTISAQLNHVVGEIENHDAVIKASIVDLKKKIAEANVRRNSLNSHVTKIQKEILKCKSNTELWKTRAIESAKHDETKALSCISRSIQCEKQLPQLEASLLQYENMGSKLSQDMASAEESMLELIQKHNLMRARQTSHSALKASQSINDDSSSLLNDTFERWEIKLQQSELSLDSYPNIDTFEQEFVQQEQKEDLQKALNKLLTKEQGVAQ